MARPKKIGLDYFNFDVDFFQNKKVRRIKLACGPQSITVLLNLLCNIYRDKGYYIEWDEDLPFLIADEIGISEGAALEVIKKAVQVKFFNPEIAEKGYLTSKEIQSRYARICRDAKRTNWEISEKIILIDGVNKVYSGKTTEETKLSPPKSTQRKVKESKGKNSKVENKKKSSRFSPPSQDEVYDYLLEKKFHPSLAKLESEKFWNFYDSKNWYVGKNKMKKWKSAVSGWINRMSDFKKTKTTHNGNESNTTDQKFGRQTADDIKSDLTGWGP